MDEISAEDEIREAFKVFDSVSWKRGKTQEVLPFQNWGFDSVSWERVQNTTSWNGFHFRMDSQHGKRVQNTTITEKLPFLKIPFVSEWRWFHQPARAGLCHGQLGIADGQGWNWGRLWIDHIWSSCFTFHNFGFTKMEKGEIKVEP